MENRLKKREINVGGVIIGGDAPISVQSMLNTKTHDVEACLRQIKELEEAGCDIVRLAVPDEKAVAALKKIREGTKVPLVADIHFNYKYALAAMEAGFNKIRINPGNIGEEKNVKAVVDCAKMHKVPLRIGVNGGSLEKDLMDKYGASPKALCESALNHARILEKYGFYDTAISIKSSHVNDCVAAYRLMNTLCDYPLHIGVTETGTQYMGLIKSAAGIGSLLLDGIGSTLRVSLCTDPVEEVKAGIAILKAIGLRQEGVNLIACPTCGRTEIDLFSTLKKVELLLKDIKKPLNVAVMGCIVNGPGEAKSADYGIAGGCGRGIIFKKGEVVKTVSEENLPQELYNLIAQDGNL